VAPLYFDENKVDRLSRRDAAKECQNNTCISWHHFKDVIVSDKSGLGFWPTL